MSRVTAALIAIFLGVSALHAANAGGPLYTVRVEIEGQTTPGKFLVEDVYNTKVQHIRCPGTCSAQFSGPAPVLSVTEDEDPLLHSNTGNGVDPPFEYYFESGCTLNMHPWHLDAAGGLCQPVVPKNGEALVVLRVRYRPLITLSFVGEYDNFENTLVDWSSRCLNSCNSGGACYIARAPAGCHNHVPPGEPVTLTAHPAYAAGFWVKSWGNTCHGNTAPPSSSGLIETNVVEKCTFVPEKDTCIRITLGDPYTDFPIPGHTPGAYATKIDSPCEGTGPSAGPPAPPTLETKQATQNDLRTAVEEAKAACGYQALGLGFVATGALVGGGIAGGVLIAAGVEMAEAGPNSLCASVLLRIRYDVSVINDPPLANTHDAAVVRALPVATLPACTRGPSLAFCDKLRGALLALAASTGHATAVAQALATTIGRLSTATKQHDAAGIRIQTASLKKLTSGFESATGTDGKHWAQVASILKGNHLDIQLSAAATSKQIAVVVAKLKAQKVDLSVLRSSDPSGLTPAATDFDTELVAGTPPPVTPTIASVTMTGGATNPSFAIHGTNLGKLPAADPSGHPSGQNGCPVVSGDNGYDYGTSLYVASLDHGWSGGRYRPTMNETDCIDLVVTRFTGTEIDFHFGPFFAQHASQFPLADGDVLDVVVNGSTYSLRVKQ
jgi:hypothetical protein